MGCVLLWRAHDLVGRYLYNISQGYIKNEKKNILHLHRTKYGYYHINYTTYNSHVSFVVSGGGDIDVVIRYFCIIKGKDYITNRNSLHLHQAGYEYHRINPQWRLIIAQRQRSEREWWKVGRSMAQLFLRLSRASFYMTSSQYTEDALGERQLLPEPDDKLLWSVEWLPF